MQGLQFIDLVWSVCMVVQSRVTKSLQLIVIFPTQGKSFLKLCWEIFDGSVRVLVGHTDTILFPAGQVLGVGSGEGEEWQPLDSIEHNLKMASDLGKRSTRPDEQSNPPHTEAQSAAPAKQDGGILDFMMPTGAFDIMKEVFSGLPTPKEPTPAQTPRAEPREEPQVIEASPVKPATPAKEPTP